MEDINVIPGRISIVTIVLNQKDLIAATMESALSQENVALEYIVIDGGSTDGTLAVIEQYRDQIQHFHSDRDGGIYQAINKGIGCATAPVVGLIHCGDFLMPGALSEVCNIFYQSYPDVIYGDIEIAEEVGVKFVRTQHKADHQLLDKRMSIFHPSTFVKKSVYETEGVYDTQYRSAADYDFFLGLFLKGYRFLHIPKVFAVFSAGGVSEKDFKQAKSENYRIRTAKLGKTAAAVYWIKSTLGHYFFSNRKKIITGLIGANNFNRLKIFLKKETGK